MLLCGSFAAFCGFRLVAQHVKELTEARRPGMNKASKKLDNDCAGDFTDPFQLRSLLRSLEMARGLAASVASTSGTNTKDRRPAAAAGHQSHSNHLLCSQWIRAPSRSQALRFGLRATFGYGDGEKERCTKRARETPALL